MKEKNYKITKSIMNLIKSIAKLQKATLKNKNNYDINKLGKKCEKLERKLQSFNIPFFYFTNISSK